MFDSQTARNALVNFVEKAVEEHSLPWVAEVIAEKAWVVSADGFRVMECPNVEDAETWADYANSLGPVEMEDLEDLFARQTDCDAEVGIELEAAA